MQIKLDESTLSLTTLLAAGADLTAEVELDQILLERCERSHHRLLELLEDNLPIYGVTTGYGDSCHRFVSPEQSETLQSNLVDYLRCGTGPSLSRFAAKAMCLARLRSLSLGYSGVSPALIEHMVRVLNAGIVPHVPCEGSLGASGDLIPLAYYAATLQGKGDVLGDGDLPEPALATLKRAGLKPYCLKAKEGLALVNGTSAMVGVAAENYSDARFLMQISVVASSWLCMALNGRIDAFGPLINQAAKNHPGQRWCAEQISSLLQAEDYQGTQLRDVLVKEGVTTGFVQDRYSLRCTPQILGPVIETLYQLRQWLSAELNSVADNPVIDPDSGAVAMGGNFYGGYLGHGIDYLKICVGNMADLIDRQLMTLIDDKANRGLPPNLANWPDIPAQERHLHHGLKGLHQAVNAITAEILNLATPNTIFSRSSELHNQDKVSMGMGSAMSCRQMLDKFYSVTAMNLICACQALDLRKVQLRGQVSQELYELVRTCVPFVQGDQPLGQAIATLRRKMKHLADAQKDWLPNELL